MKKNTFLSLLAGVALALTLQQADAGESGFIENMPPLEPDADRTGAMIWVKPGVDRAAYTRVMIEPITIFISPESEYKGISPEQLSILSQKFMEASLNAFEPEVPVVNKSGPGVLYIRAAITNVKIAKKKRGLLGYTPIGFIAGAVKEAAEGPSISLKDAVLEIESYDSVSKERLGVLIDKAPETGNEKLSWDSIAKTCSYYAERFKLRMQAAK